MCVCMCVCVHMHFGEQACVSHCRAPLQHIVIFTTPYPLNQVNSLFEHFQDAAAVPTPGHRGTVTVRGKELKRGGVVVRRWGVGWVKVHGFKGYISMQSSHHQDPIMSIDCLFQERPVTSGGADKSVRVWRVVEESQLVFGGQRASIDCVKLINEDHFVTGSQDG